jgi:3-oxoacyl-[acyl-carrier protein] reductase
MMADSRRLAVVTGGTRGLGLAIVDGFLELGVDVVALHRQARAESPARSGLRFVQCDVRDFGAVKDATSALEKEYGQVHYLVNNAGVCRDASLFRMEPEHWREVLDTNLTGAFNLCRNVVLKMMKRGFGRIINISSVSGILGSAGQSNYAASKAGLIAFTKSVAREVATMGVTCNAIAPGYIESDMTSSLPDKVKERARGMIPAGRFGQANEVVSAVRFLCAEDSKYVNGAVITVDGGLT